MPKQYLCQAPKEWAKQSAGFRKKYKGFDDLPRDGSFLMQPKYDGCHGIVNTNQVQMWSRTGEQVQSCDHISSQLYYVFGPDWVIFGEVWKFDTKFKDISGAYRRHSLQPDLKFVAYDMVSAEAYASGVCAVPYAARYETMKTVLVHRPQPALIIAACADLDPSADPLAFADALVKTGGYDGCVVRDRRAPWAPGAAKQGEVIKVKPLETLDLQAINVIEGEGKQAGMMGAIEVIYKGVVTKVGTGFSDDERRWWWDGVPNVLPIVEVAFMEVTEEGKLREPRFKGIRHDKVKPD